MLNTQMEVRMAIDHGGDDEVVMVVCRHLNQIQRELEARKLVTSVTVSNSTTTVDALTAGILGANYLLGVRQ